MTFLSTASFTQQVPEQRLNLLTKGISIPHWYWLRQPTVLIDHFINDQDIEILVKLGVRHVQIPFEMADLDKPRIVEQLKCDIKRLTEHKVAVIVSAFGQKYNHEYIATDKGIKVLQQLCSVMKGTPPDLVFVQIANEPFLLDPKSLSQVQDKLLQGARQILPHHTLITSTPLKFASGSGDWDMIKAFQITRPSDDKNVIYAFHFYDPYFFTHQGADWDPTTHSIKHLVYPTNLDNQKNVIAGLPKNLAPWIIKALANTWDKAQLRAALVPILEWRKQHQRPVMVTEFGVYKANVDTNSRQLWFKDVISLFNDEHILWTFWDYDAGFGLFSTQEGFRDLDKEIAKSLGFLL